MKKQSLKSLLKYLLCSLLGLSLLYYFISCSEVNFNTLAIQNCLGLEGLPGTYECEDDEDVTHVTQKLSLGLADMLFVVDNSKSMYEDQKMIADKFSNLLDVIEDVDFHIAITTTDVDDREPGTNPGALLRFPNGKNILTKRSVNVLSSFQNTIKRKETLDCEEGKSVCPSGDERGIYAANKVVESQNSSFFRKQAHLAIIFISDEDVRSQGGDLKYFDLESLDLPETLVSNVIKNLGASKLLSAHAIVVDDQSCLNEQKAQNPNHLPVIGNQYIKLAEKKALSQYNNLVEGTVGSLCASDYAEQMKGIGDLIKSHTYKVQLACTPLEGTLVVRIGEDLISDSDFILDEEDRLIFDEELPSARKIHITYDCTRF